MPYWTIRSPCGTTWVIPRENLGITSGFGGQGVIPRYPARLSRNLPRVPHEKEGLSRFSRTEQERETMTDYLALLESDHSEPTRTVGSTPQNPETQHAGPRDTGVSSPVLPMPSPAVTVTRLEPEPIEAEDGHELLPTQSPWLELSENAQGIWDALEARGTRTLHLIDQDGRKACHAFTASKPSEIGRASCRERVLMPV